MFNITDGKGFQITFSNGWTVSVQFGPDNFCERRHVSKNSSKSIDAEIAAWNDQTGAWHKFGNNEYKGSCSPSEVAEFISIISKKGKR
jgi:hypothetical protein